MDNAMLQLDTCKSTEKRQKTESQAESEVTLFDEITHCPINKDGTPVQAHIFQINLEDNAYVSDMYVGNKPQLVRALFDTGSTNTWILNSKVELPNNAQKERSFNDALSTTFQPTNQRA